MHTAYVHRDEPVLILFLTLRLVAWDLPIRFVPLTDRSYPSHSRFQARVRTDHTYTDDGNSE